MLACWECKNLDAFVQVSTRADARPLRQSNVSGLEAGAWAFADPRRPGLYCAQCEEPIEGDVTELELEDDRIDFVDPHEFRADVLVEELKALRPDATWEQLNLPAQAPRYRELSLPLAAPVADALRRTGRDRLYTHQTAAIEAALRGEHVVQATPAGSGKSLGFVLPVLDALARDDAATALFVFPLKALANDQLNGLARFGTHEVWIDNSSFDLQLAEDSAPIRVGRYDGTTMEHEKVGIRRSARIVITTPDMLHASMLRMAHGVYKDKSSWGPFFRGLRFVVLDEIHNYQGVFGSAVANVLRRLRRSADRVGASPQFLTASATIGNPTELAESLTGVSPFHLVDDDGSARRDRAVLICNPPERDRGSAAAKALVTKKEQDESGADVSELLDGGRIAPQTIAIDVVSKALASEDHPPVRTIGFCRSRNAVFQLSKRIQSNLGELRRSDLAEHVAPYAATFLSDDRVQEEGRLRDGTTLAIISTSALELGIDIPDLSLAVLVGYPGQISSFRQRAGRVGRTGEGLAVLIVGDDPLQQFVARDPATLERLLSAKAEDVVVNATVPEIARRYGLGPAQEEFGGIAFEDAAYFGSEVVDQWLEDASGNPACEIKGVPYWHQLWPEDPYANLRSSVPGRSYTVFAGRRDQTPIGVIGEGSAPRDAFVPAIWTGPGGDLYRVIGFEQSLGEIYCEGPVEVRYQTRGVSVDRVEVVNDLQPRIARGDATVGYGALSISRQVFSYKEQHFSGVEKSKQPERSWPPINFQTDGLIVDVPATWFADDVARESAIRSVEHVLLSVAPAVVACDPNDLDASKDRYAIYLYDSFGGGLRMSEVLYHRFDELLEIGVEVVATCPCAGGCPSCIMLSRRPDGNKELSKAGALDLLHRLRSAGRSLANPRTTAATTLRAASRE